MGKKRKKNTYIYTHTLLMAMFFEYIYRFQKWPMENCSHFHYYGLWYILSAFRQREGNLQEGEESLRGLLCGKTILEIAVDFLKLLSKI